MAQFFYIISPNNNVCVMLAFHKASSYETSNNVPDIPAMEFSNSCLDSISKVIIWLIGV